MLRIMSVLLRPSAALVVSALAVFSFTLVSCMVNQTIVLKADGSGTLAMHAEVSKLLQEYMASLAEVSGKTVAPGETLFDAAAIRKDFASRPGITVKKVATPTPGSLDVEIAYTSLKDVFAKDPAVSAAGAITLTESAGQKTVRFHLDRTNYSQLSALFPVLKDPAFSSLAPQVSDTITETEYMDMVQFSLGDAGPAALKKSFITLTIDPEGDIVSQSGGAVKGGTVEFRIPLVRLLVLDTPLEYSVTYK